MGQIDPSWLDTTLAYARDSALTGQATDLYRSAMLLRTVSDVAMQAAMAPPAMMFEAAPPPFFDGAAHMHATAPPPPPSSPLLELLGAALGQAAGSSPFASGSTSTTDPRSQITAALLRLVIQRVLSNMRR